MDTLRGFSLPWTRGAGYIRNETTCNQGHFVLALIAPCAGCDDCSVINQSTTSSSRSCAAATATASSSSRPWKDLPATEKKQMDKLSE
mmetsp:Transcript_11584/g.33351  ORF Transcript_11584/g.33351 Transcript_11584/m.33351 type:complete len:88 (+) Transcript_11584:2894-3157(+)